MTVTTVYATAPGGEGHVASINATYATARTGGTMAVSNFHLTGQAYGSGSYYVYESFIIFDTSGIPDGDTVSAVVLSCDGRTDYSTSNFVTGVAASAYDGGAVVTGDWVSGASIPTPELATWNSSGFTTGYNAFTETASFKSAISKTGNTSLILYSQEHRDNSAPTTYEYVIFEDADAAGTTQDPKLDITHAAPPPSGTGALVVPFVEMAATGKQTAAGTGALVVPFLELAGAGTQVAATEGTGAFVVPFLTLAATGVMQPSGTGAFVVPFMELAGAGKQTAAGTSALVVPFMELAGAGVRVFAGTGALTVPFIELAAAGAQIMAGTGAWAVPFIELAGVGAILLPVGTAGLVVPFLVLAGVGAETPKGTGARQYWRSTRHQEYTKLVVYRDYRSATTHKDYIKHVRWVDRA